MPKTLKDTQVSVLNILHTISFITARNKKNIIHAFVAIRQPLSVRFKAGDSSIFKKNFPERRPRNNIRARVRFIKVGFILINVSSLNAIVRDPKSKIKNKVITWVLGTFLLRI